MNLNPFAKKQPAEKAPQLDNSYGPQGPPGPPGPEGPVPPSGRIVPIDEVRALSSRGVPEPDIIRTLRREGYATGEIDQAMKDALRSRVSEGPPPMDSRYGPGQTQSSEEFPSRDQVPRNLTYPASDAMQQEESLPPPPSYGPQTTPEIPNMPTGNDFGRQPLQPASAPVQPAKDPRAGGIDRKEMEELTEVIVEEKLRELREKFKFIDTQFQQYTKKMELISAEMEKMKTEKSGEVKGIETKIDDYSRNMGEYNGRIESLEKALKDSLTPMMESIRSLSDLVKTMKEQKKE